MTATNVQPVNDQVRWGQGITYANCEDERGNPTGGYVAGVGLEIIWQDGPLGRDGERKEPNGAFVIDVIHAALQRLQFYQQGPYKCRENSLAITNLEQALHWLQSRHDAREARQVQGLHVA